MAKSMKLGGGGKFAKLKGQLAAKGAHDPAALAAYIGRKKYGAAKMSEMAKHGHARKYSHPGH